MNKKSKFLSIELKRNAAKSRCFDDLTHKISLPIGV